MAPFQRGKNAGGQAGDRNDPRRPHLRGYPGLSRHGRPACAKALAGRGRTRPRPGSRARDPARVRGASVLAQRGERHDEHSQERRAHPGSARGPGLDGPAPRRRLRPSRGLRREAGARSEANPRDLRALRRPARRGVAVDDPAVFPRSLRRGPAERKADRPRHPRGPRPRRGLHLRALRRRRQGPDPSPPHRPRCPHRGSCPPLGEPQGVPRGRRGSGLGPFARGARAREGAPRRRRVAVLRRAGPPDTPAPDRLRRTRGDRRGGDPLRSLPAAPQRALRQLGAQPRGGAGPARGPAA